jgi:hypothetical protein
VVSSQLEEVKVLRQSEIVVLLKQQFLGITGTPDAGSSLTFTLYTLKVLNLL